MSNRTFTMIKPDAVRNGHIGNILQTPDIAERLTRQGVDIVFSPADKFDAVLKSDIERNTATLRAAGVGAQ